MSQCQVKIGNGSGAGHGRAVVPWALVSAKPLAPAGLTIGFSTSCHKSLTCKRPGCEAPLQSVCQVSDAGGCLADRLQLYHKIPSPLQRFAGQPGVNAGSCELPSVSACLPALLHNSLLLPGTPKRISSVRLGGPAGRVAADVPQPSKRER